MNQEIMPKLIQKAQQTTIEKFDNRVCRVLDDRPNKTRIRKSRDCNRPYIFGQKLKDIKRDRSSKSMRHYNVLRVTSLTVQDNKSDNSKFQHIQF